jgi:AraC family transcriptional regulator, positive regulator of tynA and feaB
LASIYRLSTAAVAPSKRVAFWNDLCANAYRPMVVDARPDGFKGVFTRLCSEELEITSVKSTPLITRTAASTVRSCADENTFSLQVVHAGSCRLRHGNTETFAGMGDILVADGSKTFELAFAVPVQGLVLSLPWNRFKDHAGKFEALSGQRLNVTHGPGAVLSTFIRSSWEQFVEYEKGEWPDSASEVIWDLLTSVLNGESRREADLGRADDLRRKAKDLIDGELSDPTFSGTVMAQALGISTRYLQRVFAEIGTTPSRFLLARRLEAAAALLRTPDKPRSVTDTALRCGFGDLSYFSREFRRRFGVSPRAYRLRSGT